VDGTFGGRDLKQSIRHLVQLQEIAFEIRDLELRQAKAPARLEELDAAFQATIEEIGSARLTHEALVQRRRELDEERSTATLRLEKAQKKLMTVSNQREYSAVLNEIDATKTQLGQLTAGIAECDEQIDELAEPAAEADTLISAEREKIDAEKVRVSKDGENARVRLVELAELREKIVSELSPADVQRFEAVFRARAGIAMAAVVNGACSACHVKLRPQVVALVRRGSDLVSCDSCRRLLFVPDELAADDDSDGRSPVGETGPRPGSAPQAG